MPEPVPTRHLDHGGAAVKLRVSDNSVHGHLHADVPVPNSCYMEDIYCCDSAIVALTVLSANPAVVDVTAINK